MPSMLHFRNEKGPVHLTGGHFDAVALQATAVTLFSNKRQATEATYVRKLLSGLSQIGEQLPTVSRFACLR